MKVLPLAELKNVPFCISDISVLYKYSGWNVLETDFRKLNGFLLLQKGECTYYWNGQEAHLSPGSLIYLPRGGKHSVRTDRFEYYRIDFVITDPRDNEQILFSDHPWVVTHDAPEEMYDAARSLVRNTLSDENVLASTADLCTFLSSIRRLIRPKSESRIAAAVDYLQLHYIENVSVEKLADLCYMSQPHLHRLFKQQLGQSPIEYRNALRIRRACTLLGDEECSIGEIASLLGFESIYYFSRVFRQYTGLSPTEYRKKENRAV